MTLNEVKSRLKTVLQSMDKMSCAGALELKGLGTVQEFAGCTAILSEISELSSIEPEEEKTFK
jgi:hypothetical protein